MIFPQVGIWSIGIKTPLMKIKGNLISVESIITLEGLSVGGAESKLPNVEKQNAERSIPKTKTMGWVSIVPKKTIPKNSGIAEKTTPKAKPAKISPKRMAGIEMGVEISRSNVFILVSQGTMIGATEEAVEKSVIPIKPGIREEGDTLRPMAKAKKRNNGKSTPEISTGGLR